MANLRKVKEDATAHKYEVSFYRTSLIIIPNKVLKTGLCTVYVELSISFTHDGITSERKRFRFNTNLFVAPKDWSVAKSESKSDFKLNTRLKQFKLDFDNKIAAMQAGERTDLPEEMKMLQKFFATGKAKMKAKAKGLLEYIDEYIIHRKDKGTPRGTLKEFTTVRNRLAGYEAATGTTLYFENINLTFSDDLIKHFSKQEYDPNTIKKSFVILKTVLNHYYSRKDEINIELSDRFRDKNFGKVVEHSSEPLPLNDIEIELVKNADIEKLKHEQIKKFNKENKKNEKYSASLMLQNIEKKFEGMEKTKQRVLIQLSTGLRVSDLFKIKPANIKKEMIVLRASKTLNTKEDSTVYIPLNGVSKPILKDLGYDSSKLKISSQKYNDSIKTFLEAVGLDDDVEVLTYKGIGTPSIEYKKKHEVITSHNLRDTFISKGIRENVPIPVLLKATGQVPMK